MQQCNTPIEVPTLLADLRMKKLTSGTNSYASSTINAILLYFVSSHLKVWIYLAGMILSIASVYTQVTDSSPDLCFWQLWVSWSTKNVDKQANFGGKMKLGSFDRGLYGKHHDIDSVGTYVRIVVC